MDPNAGASQGHQSRFTRTAPSLYPSGPTPVPSQTVNPRRTWGSTGARDCAPPRLWWPSDPPLVNTRSRGPAALPPVVRTHSQQSEPSSFRAVARPHLRGRSMLTGEPAFPRPTPCQAECACPECSVDRWGSCARQFAPTSTSERICCHCSSGSACARSSHHRHAHQHKGNCFSPSYLTAASLPAWT